MGFINCIGILPGYCLVCLVLSNSYNEQLLSVLQCHTISYMCIECVCIYIFLYNTISLHMYVYIYITIYYYIFLYIIQYLYMYIYNTLYIYIYLYIYMYIYIHIKCWVKVPTPKGSKMSSPRPRSRSCTVPRRRGRRSAAGLLPSRPKGQSPPKRRPQKRPATHGINKSQKISINIGSTIHGKLESYDVESKVCQHCLWWAWAAWWTVKQIEKLHARSEQAP